MAVEFGLGQGKTARPTRFFWPRSRSIVPASLSIAMASSFRRCFISHLTRRPRPQDGGEARDFPILREAYQPSLTL